MSWLHGSLKHLQCICNLTHTDLCTSGCAWPEPEVNIWCHHICLLAFRQMRAGDQERIHAEMERRSARRVAVNSLLGTYCTIKGSGGMLHHKNFETILCSCYIFAGTSCAYSHNIMNDELIILFSWMICWYLYHPDNCGRCYTGAHQILNCAWWIQTPLYPVSWL